MASSLELLISGLLSHGFHEGEAVGCWRRFTRLGRKDRWVEENTLTIRIGELGDSLRIPFEVRLSQPRGKIVTSDYHALLLKCGAIRLRTREKYEERKKPPQKAFDFDKLLDEL